GHGEASAVIIRVNEIAFAGYWLRIPGLWACGNEAAGERSTGSTHCSDVQKQYPLFGSGPRVQEALYHDRARRKPRQSVQGSAAIGYAPQHAEPDHARTEDRCSSLARRRQASAAERASRHAGKKTDSLVQVSALSPVSFGCAMLVDPAATNVGRRCGRKGYDRARIKNSVSCISGRYESEIRSGSGGDESRLQYCSPECRSPEGDAHALGPCQRFFRHQDDSRRSNRLREGERHYSGHIRQDLAR